MGPTMEGETLHRCIYAFVCIHTHTHRKKETERKAGSQEVCLLTSHPLSSSGWGTYISAMKPH